MLPLENMANVSEVPSDPEGGSTPPPATAIVAGTKTSSSKGEEEPSAVHEEHGYVTLWTNMQPRSFALTTYCTIRALAICLKGITLGSSNINTYM
jgi:hypothetical protein